MQASMHTHGMWAEAVCIFEVEAAASAAEEEGAPPPQACAVEKVPPL